MLRIEFWIFKIKQTNENQPYSFCPYHYLGSGQKEMISFWGQLHSVTKIPSIKVYEQVRDT